MPNSASTGSWSEVKLRDLLLADLHRYDDLLGRARAPLTAPRLIKMVLNPRLTPVVLCRVSRRAFEKNNRPLSYLAMWANVALFGIEITPRAQIGPGLFFPHTSGTVLGAGRIGKNATIYQGVTLGARTLDMQYDESTRPVVGDDVIIAAGAKVVGPVRLGHGCRIGANSVVLIDVPDGATAVGIPAVVRDGTT